MSMQWILGVRGSLGVVAVLCLGAMPLAAQRPADGGAAPAAKYTQPRTPWGDPDLQGTWTSDGDAGVPFERPSQFGTKETLEADELEEVLAQRQEQKEESAPVAGGITGAGPTHWYENWQGHSSRTSMVVDPADGRIPALTPEAVRKNQARASARRGRGDADSYADRSLWDRCITRTLPNAMFPTLYNNNVRITQAPGYVVITHEMIHDARVVPLDGRPALPSTIRQYNGDSRGHWDGDTLVVSVTNFTDHTNYRGSGDTLHLVERFTRTGPDSVRYDVTIDDPKTFVKPWTAALNLTPQEDVFEYGCHEGNYAMKHILSGARAEERSAPGKEPR